MATESAAPNPPHGGSWLRMPDGSLRPASAPPAEPAAPAPAGPAAPNAEQE